ncbi:MAG: FixH family protein [Ignavibacteriales bacterium]|nr:FixH family protein [Ignavibacteriales bacterium]
MKINWGVGITISIIIFTLITFWFVYFAFNQDVNLVRDDYYEAETKYNDRMETIKRTNALSENLNIRIVSKNIELRFPSNLIDKTITGNIILYRPSDRKLDINIPIKVEDSNLQLIGTQNLISGMWKIQVDWNVDNLSYFNEKILMVQ